MYQTVGQDAIEVVAEALDVPLYRRVISGDAVNRGNEYGARSAQGSAELKGDETEDLYDLLSTVLVSVEHFHEGCLVTNISDRSITPKSRASPSEPSSLTTNAFALNMCTFHPVAHPLILTSPNFHKLPPPWSHRSRLPMAARPS